MFFLVNIAEFSRSLALKNFCERLLLSGVILARSKFLLQNENIKIITKIMNLKKKKKKKKKNPIITNTILIYIMFKYCFPTKSSESTKILKVKTRVF